MGGQRSDTSHLRREVHGLPDEAVSQDAPFMPKMSDQPGLKEFVPGPGANEDAAALYQKIMGTGLEKLPHGISCKRSQKTGNLWFLDHLQRFAYRDSDEAENVYQTMFERGTANAKQGVWIARPVQ